MKSLALIITLYVLVSCGNKAEKTTGSLINSIDSAVVNTVVTDSQNDVPDIEISVNIRNDSRENICHVVYNASSKNGILNIEPSTYYYDKFISDKEVQLSWIAYFENISYEECTYPDIECYLVNNTDKAVSINSLSLVVSESCVDDLPYVIVASEEKYSNTLGFINESWYNWGDALLEYKILKKGDVFDGKYDRKVSIPYFKDIYRINFLDELKEMGYDYEAVQKESHDKSDKGCIFINIDDDNHEKFEKLFYPFEITKDTTFADGYMYVGFARIHGRLSFTKSDKVFRFRTGISLSTYAGFGAGMYDEDKFNVQLKTTGKDYVVNMPYTTTLQSGDSEMVLISVKCSKSSNHYFTIKADNDNDLNISTKPIKLHMLKHRHS